MPNLKSLSKRIKSVKSTQKITRVMKMIAASKIASSSKSASNSIHYCMELNQCLAQLVHNYQGKLPWYVSGNPSGGTLVIPISSARGMCGGYNATIAKSADALIKEDLNEKFSIIAIGKKIGDHIRRTHPEVAILDHLDKPGVDLVDASKVVDTIYSQQEHPCKVFIVFTHFVSSIKQILTVKQLLPFQPDDGVAPHIYSSYEPNMDKILPTLSYDYMCSCVYTCMMSAIASENFARMIAMDNATKNAKEVIDQLTLSYNRTRQALITKELVEIISGAESIKEG